MSTTLLNTNIADDETAASIQNKVNQSIDDLIASLPSINSLTREQRRDIIARYTAVLEGNFIYWMTATLLAVGTEEAKPILLENLHEEVRDSHPAMMRRFAVAARAYPTAEDALAVDPDLTHVRLFLGKLSGVQSLLTMAFFEGFIQKFMPYLAGLARAQGSSEMEYTDVHGVCDIEHTAGLFRAFEMESLAYPLETGNNPFEGVELLRKLIETIVFYDPERAAA